MLNITAYVITQIEVDLAVRDDEEQREYFDDMGVNLSLYEEEGIVSINDSTLTDFVSSRYFPICDPKTTFLNDLCNDLEWAYIERVVKEQVEELMSRKREREGEDEDFPDPKKSKHE